MLKPIQGGEHSRAPPGQPLPTGTERAAILERRVNGQPGLVGQQDGVTVTVFVFEVAAGRIRHIWAIRNPDKLLPCRITSPEEPNTTHGRLLPGPWNLTTTWY